MAGQPPASLFRRSRKMKKTVVFALVLLTLLSASAAWATDIRVETCPTCLFPHVDAIAHVKVPSPPTMLTPVTVPYAAPAGTVVDGNDEVSLTLSVGATRGMAAWSWWLDCLTPIGDEENLWSVDVRAGLHIARTDMLSLGFETGAILTLDDGVEAYDIPMMLKMSLLPGSGAFRFPLRLGVGVFTGFSPVSREVSFGSAADASVGIQMELGDVFTVALETRVEALMRLDVANGRDSTLELMWVPGVVSVGARF